MMKRKKDLKVFQYIVCLTAIDSKYVSVRQFIKDLDR